MATYDVLILGSGQAGVPLAARFAKLGKRVGIVERGDPGGTCVNVGCTPTKTMVASARAAHVARTAGRLGVRISDVQVDFGAVIARKDEIVKRWRNGIEKRLSGEGITLIRGHARFVGPKKVDVSGQHIDAETIIVNVGARPNVPAIAGIEAAKNSSEIMNLTVLPKHLVVLGGGYIGCEFGQMFRRFGSAVTIVDHNLHLLSREDSEVSTELESVFRREGIDLRLGADVTAISQHPEGPIVSLKDQTTLRATHVLSAVGRIPNTDDLGCSAAGITTDARGYIQVDDRFATSSPGVYAVGDVTPGPQFTHNAWDDHRLLFDHLVNGSGNQARSGRLVPYSVFTDPHVAGVGMSEKEARDAGLDIEVATMKFGDIARAIEMDETAGVMKLVIEAKTERILGARIMGVEAAELIHVFVVLMQAGATASALASVQCVHPALAEGLQSLVMRLPRYALT